MFEPFHSEMVESFRRCHYFPYLRTNQDDNYVSDYCRQVLSGESRHPWIDLKANRLFPKYRLVKEIRANLFLKSSPDNPKSHFYS